MAITGILEGYSAVVASLWFTIPKEDGDQPKPPSICPKCGRNTKFGGYCECQQILR
ncbi:MAG: hypothetical protein M3258_06270 [Thermoproteota archaeon]|nr:hypothetical protein [Thermoproteota archaeon]